MLRDDAAAGSGGCGPGIGGKAARNTGSRGGEHEDSPGPPRPSWTRTLPVMAWTETIISLSQASTASPRPALPSAPAGRKDFLTSPLPALAPDWPDILEKCGTILLSPLPRLMPTLSGHCLVSGDFTKSMRLRSLLFLQRVSVAVTEERKPGVYPPECRGEKGDSHLFCVAFTPRACLT